LSGFPPLLTRETVRPGRDMFRVLCKEEKVV
jgi:hypothetical protein